MSPPLKQTQIIRIEKESVTIRSSCCSYRQWYEMGGRCM